jgi:two-component system response regulator HydG
MVSPAFFDKGVTRSLKDVEKDCILATLEKTGGNRKQASELMGVGVATLYRKLKGYKLLDRIKK